MDPKVCEAVSEEAGFDAEKAFQTYAQFGGDVVRTAHAMNVTSVKILRVAEQLKWHQKLEKILELRNSGKPGDVERGLSRAMNFVQAHRMRIVLERVLDRLYNMSTEELFQMACATKTTKDKDGNVTETQALNTRPFADIAAALEKCHMMTYVALSDTIGERTKRVEEREDTISATQLHSIIAQAMSEAAPPNHPATQLLNEALAEGEANRKEAQP